MSQVVEFRVEEEPISVSPRDATRIVEALREDANPQGSTAAENIERAMKLHEDTTVRLAIGEDERVLKVLADLQATGDFLSPLKRLQRALTAKIDREG